MKSPPPIHQWTHTGDKVLFVKMINKDRTTGGGGQPKIVWPESGPVECSDWKPQAVCGNGIHAWPWGMFVGDGKKPNVCQPWLVLSVDPADVVQIDGGKCKFPKCEVVYSGEMAGAMHYTSTGRVAWIVDSASGSAAATGYRGSAAATGDSGSAAATGARGSAAATGYRGSAAATGDSGSAAATRASGSAAATGGRGSAAATGYRGSAAATGGRGSAAATGARGSAAATGDSGSAAATGGSGSAAATGDSGSAAATGDSGSAAATGGSGSAAATGDSGIAAITVADEYSIIEVSTTGIGAVQGEMFKWKVHMGAVIIQRWTSGVAMLKGMKKNDGKTVLVVKGKVQK